jgi:hypothetical protein
LSNPSVSNATASFQPAASSAISTSPEASIHSGNGDQIPESSGSAAGDVGLVSEIGGGGQSVYGSTGGSSVVFPSSDTVKFSNRLRNRANTGSTINQDRSTQNGHRVVDALASQLDVMRIIGTPLYGSLGDTDKPTGNGETVSEPLQRRHTTIARTLTAGSGATEPPTESIGKDVDERSSTRLSNYGLMKSTNPPPRPPRHVQRASEELLLLSATSRHGTEGSCARPPDTSIDNDNPSRNAHDGAEGVRATDGQHHAGNTAVKNPSSVVRSLGRTAARRVSRVLGQEQQTHRPADEPDLGVD